MKTSILTTIALAGIMASGMLSTIAYGAGTPAGTIITNTATMNYKDLAGNSFPAINASVSVTVAQLAGVAVTPATSSQTSGDSVDVDHPVVVTNTGNGTDVFNLAALSSQGWGPLLYIDADRNGVLDPAEFLAGSVSATPSLSADSSSYLIARIFVPRNTPSNTTDSLQVTATSQFDAGVSASGLYTTTVSIAQLAISKIQSISNPQPGQAITYTINYINNGTGSATSSVASDPLDLNVTLVNGSITGGGTYNSGNRTISWNLGSIGGGQSGSVSFQVTVNAAVPSGTNLSNQVTFSYVDSTTGFNRTSTSNQTGATVATAPSLSSTISPLTLIQDVGLTVQYNLTLTNTGNAPDSASLTFASNGGLNWAFYVDANSNGILDGPDFPASPANLGPLSQGGVIQIIALDTIPTATIDGSIDTSDFTFTSLSSPSTNSTVTGITTMKAPVMSISKSVIVVGGGPSIPGATLRYTINYQNNGTGAGANVIITDPIPSATNYVANSVRHNGNAKTDAADGDEVTVNAGLIQVNVGSLGSSGNGTIDFDVIIQ